MRVIRSMYRGAAEWQAQRQAVQEARSAGRAAPLLEPAVVVSRPGEHGAGTGALVEAVDADGLVIYRRLISEGERAGARPEDAIEAAIQEAWRRLVCHVGPPSGEPTP